MPIVLVGSAAVPTGNPTTSFTVTIPSAVLAGDLLFLPLTSRDAVGVAPTVTDNDTGGNTWTKIASSSDQKATLWYKRATSGSASKTVTVAAALGSSSGVLKAFSGGDGGATPYTDVVVETNASGDESHVGFTPSNADSMVCCSVHNYANDNAVTSLSFATLGATAATEKTSTGGSDCGCIFGHALQTGGPSATGNLTWAQTNGTTYSITWAIKPAIAYNLPAGSGSFTETGNPATLITDRRLLADDASFLETGNPASLARSLALPASPGVFNLTGHDADLVYAPSTGYQLNAATGSFAVSSNGSTLIADRKAPSETGAFNLSGNDASLSPARRLTASMGTFQDTGQPASLVAVRKLLTEPAAFALTGFEAALLATRKLLAGVGAFVTNGAANLIYSGGAAPIYTVSRGSFLWFRRR
jgi:hypothetical protein